MLVIAKLDRLSRNVAFLAQLMDNNDVQFVVVDNPHATRFTHILAAVAEYEAAQISKRTKDALDAARSAASGLAAGGRHQGPGAFQAAAAKARAGGRAGRVLPIVRELEGPGMSLRQIAAESTERHVATPRARAWSVSSVRDLLQRDRPIA